MAQKDKLDLGEEKKPSSSKKLIFIVLGAVLGTLGAVFATLYFLGIFPPKAPDASKGHEAAAESGASGEEDEAEDSSEGGKHGKHGEVHMIYEDMEPAFVVNFQNNPEARLLQLSLSVAAENQGVIDAVKKHTPMIRNNLLMLMSAEDPARLKTAEGKDELRVKILEEINAIVKKQTRKKDGLEEVYFTAFIMQ